MIYREQLLMSLEVDRSARREYGRQVTESAGGQVGSLSPVLRVKLRAISANKVTRNRTFYPVEELEGDGQTKGYITALKPYPIPLMLDHRVSTGVFSSGDMPIPVGRAVDARVVRKGRGRREGYLEIDAVVYDRRVIEMILDGRFMTVSIGQIPSRVECSVCGLEVTSMECSNGHQRGSSYEWNGELKSCYHIMRGIELIEVSFVNVPSDSDAVVLSKSLDSGTITAGGLEMVDMEQIQESAERHADVVQESADSADVEKAVSPEQSEDAYTESDDLGDDGDDAEVPPSELYLIDGDLPFPEARLTAAQRRRLPDSAFCGPNRSFPAHDRPHVVAGLRLLGRAKLSPAQKARVRSCLLSKARRLGMKSGSDDENTLVFWLFPESALEPVLELSVHELPALPQETRVVGAYGGTVLLELPDDGFRALQTERVKTPAAQEEGATYLLAEMQEVIAQLESQLQDWMDRAQRAEEQLRLTQRESLVTQATVAAVSGGYPMAVGKSFEEIRHIFSQRSDDFLRTLIEDLSPDPMADLVSRLSDAKNPVEGLDLGDGAGIQQTPVSAESHPDGGEPVRYGAVDHMLEALRSGKLQVQDSQDPDDTEVFRVFFNYPVSK